MRPLLHGEDYSCVSDRRRRPFRTAKQFELTDRDRLLFDWLVAFEAMTRDHVARLWGINHSGASKRLRVLRDKGFIDDKSVFTGFPSILTIPAKAAGTVNGRTLLIKEMLSETSSLLALTQVEPWHTRFLLWIQLYPGQFMGTRS